MPRELIGVGNTAEGYRCGADRMIKLFKKGFSEDAIRQEYINMTAVNELGVRAPRCYGYIYEDGRTGLIYDYIEGESLLGRLLTGGDLDGCVEILADTHKQLLEKPFLQGRPIRECYRQAILRAQYLSDAARQRALDVLETLPDGDRLCHGDFHPDNVLVRGEEAYVIDFMNLYRGDPLADIARTVLLLQYTPVPDGVDDPAAFQRLKDMAAERYLAHMGVSRAEAERWMIPVLAARMAELRDDQPEHIARVHEQLSLRGVEQ